MPFLLRGRPTPARRRLRHTPGGKQPVLFDEVMEALRTLDKQAVNKEGIVHTIAACCTGAASSGVRVLLQARITPSTEYVPFPELGGETCGMIVTIYLKNRLSQPCPDRA